MAAVSLILTASTIIACSSQFVWNNIVPDPLTVGYGTGMLATGYNAQTGSLWMIGGYGYDSGSQWYNKVMEYNINTANFTVHPDFSIPDDTAQFYGQIYTQINNSIWFIVGQSFGVFDMDTKILTYPYKYNNIAVTIPLKTYYPRSKPSQPCLTHYKGRYVVIVGGDNGPQGASSWFTDGKNFQSYDIETDSWFTYDFDELSKSRSLFCCQIVNEYLYVIGGKTDNGELTDTIEKVYLYGMPNLRRSTSFWMTLTERLTEPKMLHRCSTIGDYIFVVGGLWVDHTTAISYKISTVDKINTVNTVTEWDDTVSKDSDISSDRVCVGLEAVDRVLYVMGGYMPSNQGGQGSTALEYSSKLPSLSPTLTPSVSPTIPTQNPTQTPSQQPTISPSKTPSISPSILPSKTPSVSPSARVLPSISPSESPSIWPISNTVGNHVSRTSTGIIVNVIFATSIFAFV